MKAFPMSFSIIILIGIISLHLSMSAMEFSIYKRLDLSCFGLFPKYIDIGGNLHSHIGMGEWYVMAALVTSHGHCANVASLHKHSVVLKLEENFKFWKQSKSWSIEFDWVLRMLQTPMTIFTTRLGM